MYKDAFSLRDEIGLCPNMEIELKLNERHLSLLDLFLLRQLRKMWLIEK